MALSETQKQTLMHVAQSEKYASPGSKSNRGAVWMANQSHRGVEQVQRTLDSLDTLGLIEQDGTGPSLTEKGRRALTDGTADLSFDRNPSSVERELLAELEAERESGSDGLLSRLRGLFG
ncbi:MULTISPECIES: hypothetical protein [Salinibaculum]|uniref:hypothetical protein n=1 Tax=Salinibaculum TaxID=2732368 RepID=UPI0030D623C8